MYGRPYFFQQVRQGCVGSFSFHLNKRFAASADPRPGGPEFGPSYVPAIEALVALEAGRVDERGTVVEKRPPDDGYRGRRRI